jgi:hypothetical protein
MSKNIEKLNTLLKASGHEEDIEAFSTVNFYMKGYFSTHEELSEGAKILQKALENMMKEWSNG